MGAYLKLKTSNSDYITVTMYSSSEMCKNAFADGIVIYSDRIYEIEVDFINNISNVQHSVKPDNIRNIDFYVNDEKKDCKFNFGKIILDKNERIFLDCYGYVKINLEIEFEDAGEIKYSLYETDYIPVAIRKDINSDSVRKMIKYISENFDTFLHSNGKKSFDKGGIKKSDYRSMYTQIQILKEIVFEYQSNLNYFRNNLKKSITHEEKVEKFEKIKIIDKCSIMYISQNPNQLEEVFYNTGIKVNEKYYQPKNVLMKNNVFSTNIYENRIILGFLKYLYEEIDKVIMRLSKALEKEKEVAVENEYILSSTDFKKDIWNNYNKHIQDLQIVKQKLRQLFLSYKIILKCEPLAIKQVPNITKIFLSINHYHRIFSSIVKWFTFGNYDFASENMILSFLGCSKIYEYYVLLNILNFFKKHNSIAKNYMKHDYPLSHLKKYSNTDFENTFYFEKDGLMTTVYFQPVIFSRREIEDNGIGLFRNTSISIDKPEEYYRESRGTYYTPDYIIKSVNLDGTHSYIIIDAKWSNISSVKKYSFINLVYKYLFSVSTINEKDLLLGLSVIYGKTDSGNNMDSVYNSSDFQSRTENLSPFAQFIPLSAEIDESKVDGYILEMLKTIL